MKFKPYEILTRCLKRGRIDQSLANQIAARNNFIYTEDKGFWPKDQTVFASAENKHYTNSVSLVEIKRQNIVWNSGNCFVPQPSIYAAEINASNYAFFCTRTNTWYHNDDFHEVEVEGQTVCFQTNYSNLYVWRNRTWHFSAERSNSSSSGSGSIPAYHSFSGERTEKWKNLKGMGLELEVYCNKRADLYNSLPEGIYGEQDGSLDCYSGIELVGPPHSLEDYLNDKTPWNTVFDNLRKFKAKGHNADGNYGIHVSVTKSLFTNSELAKFVLFFNQQQKLCQIVAQREKFYSGSYKKHKNLRSFANVDRIEEFKEYQATSPYGIDEWRRKKTGKMKIRVSFATDKYEAVHISGNRAEVRIFRANTRKDRILKNLEFVWAVKEYTKNAPSTLIVDETKGTADFLNWLQKNSKSYPNLSAFLVECNEKGISDKQCPAVKDFVLPKKKIPLTVSESSANV